MLAVCVSFRQNFIDYIYHIKTYHTLNYEIQLIVSAVQQPCNDDRQTNLDFSIAKIHEAAAANADLWYYPNCIWGRILSKRRL